MHTIPFFKSYDSKLKSLILEGAKFFPKAILEYQDEIEILDLSRGYLEEIPYEIGLLKNLKILFLSHNPIKTVSNALANCQHLTMLGLKSCQISSIEEGALPSTLKWLILTDNLLESLPNSIGQLTDLRKLALAGNLLTSLPENLKLCRNLELLRLGANRLNHEPDPWLFDLPLLAWYNDSGNPFSNQLEEEHYCNIISRDALEIYEIIGSSPTSQVFRATLKSNQQQVAVKFYHSHLTSDGYAHDDLRTNLKAGFHPNLISAIGKLEPVAGKPNGIVLKLAPKGFKGLGLPPNFQTITRDCFEHDSAFTYSFIKNVLVSVARALNHLHQRQISHGDIYAHNLLSNNSGETILGDYGAATICSTEKFSRRAKLESRAFGYLIDDLLNHCPESQLICSELYTLRDSCLTPNPNKRPSTWELLNTMEQL